MRASLGLRSKVEIPMEERIAGGKWPPHSKPAQPWCSIRHSRIAVSCDERPPVAAFGAAGDGGIDHRDAPLGERLLDSMKELRAHLRGEIQLSETVYHVPPETDVRALRETLGLSQTDFAALFGFNVRSLQDWEQGRRRPEIPIRAYLAVIQRDPEAVIRALRAV
jgi:putative transcriptional regulator